MAIDKTKNSQILITLPNEMVERIESYWHDQKLKSRSEAIRTLIENALDEQQKERPGR
ncbi:ribbon-helix-helix domain-containing protein [Exiguobacterium sp. s5]|uniref:CopG family ribbon-helix-helix protein n=1 Tax=Exiguobacterium sp. s5 TaxID=2751239 RepID=UPI001BED27AF|nr:ribbon-helix-helix domain-containing protein [Exiguobacterium sp. s5]